MPHEACGDLPRLRHSLHQVVIVVLQYEGARSALRANIDALLHGDLSAKLLVALLISLKIEVLNLVPLFRAHSNGEGHLEVLILITSGLHDHLALLLVLLIELDSLLEAVLAGLSCYCCAVLHIVPALNPVIEVSLMLCFSDICVVFGLRQRMVRVHEFLACCLYVINVNIGHVLSYHTARVMNPYCSIVAIGHDGPVFWGIRIEPIELQDYLNLFAFGHIVRLEFLRP